MQRKEILAEIKRLQSELDEAEAALPAHSVKPRQMQRVLDLEEEISRLEEQLAVAPPE